MIEIITGDLLEAKEKYICHQTNCISNGGAGGLAYYLFNKYTYADCYIDRKQQSMPGTIDIRGDGINNRLIINLHGQVYPGAPRYPTSELDGAKAREKYFFTGLLEIAKIKDLDSIAFPYKIGCGLGGGNWDRYFNMIYDFDAIVNGIVNEIKVSIYRREGDE